MSYALGVDLGTTYTAAAVVRSGAVVMASLGEQSAELPTVVAYGDSGQTLVGEPASRRGLSDPSSCAREFKRRIGDPSPIVVGADEASPESLMADVLRTVLENVTAAEGEPPSALAVTHPAGWGVYKLERFDEIVTQVGWPTAIRLSEPEAAARHYFARQQLEPGATIAVFDFGGGTFDAAVLRNTVDDNFELVGDVFGLERLGGVDLDEAVFQHVVGLLELAFVETGEPTAESRALARLRAECTSAREALSADTAATISVRLPGHHEEIRLTRQEFETMIRPAIADAIAVVDTTVEAAGLVSADLSAVLLVGGASRTPLVSQMVRSHFDRPTLVDAHPKHTIASGAALAAAEVGLTPPEPPSTVPTPPERIAAVSIHESDGTRDGVDSPRRRASFVLTLTGLLVVMLVTLAFGVFGRNGDAEQDAADAQSTIQVEPTDPGRSEASEVSAAGGNEPGGLASAFDAGARSEAAGEHLFHSTGLFSADGPPSSPSRLWSRDGIGGEFLSSSVAGAGGLVFTLEDRDELATLVALDGTSGDEVWSAPTEWAANLFVAGSAVVVTSVEGVIAFDQVTGDRLGFIGRPIEGSVVGFHVRGSRALLGFTTFGVGDPVANARLVDLETNETLWEHEETFTLALDLSVFLADESTVVLGTSDEIVARDVESGDELWRTREFGNFDIAMLSNGVLIVNLDGDIVGLDAASGDELWRRPGFTFQHAADARFLYTMGPSGELEAISLETGATAWAVKPSQRPSERAAVVIGNDHVYVMQSEGDVTAHRSTTGEIVWASVLDGIVGGEFVDLVGAVFDERLVVIERDRMVVFGTGGAAEGSAEDDAIAEPGAGREDSGLQLMLGDASTIPTPLASFNTGGDPFIEPGPTTEPALLWQINRQGTAVPAVAAGGLVMYPDMRAGSGSATNGYVVAVEATTGVEVWATSVGTIFRLHTTETSVIAHTFDGLVGLDIVTGERIAKVEIPSPPTGLGGLIRDGALVVGSSSPQEPNFVDSIDIATGETNWIFEDSTASSGGPSKLFAGEETAVVALERSAIGIDLSTGEELWRSVDFGASDVILMRGELLLVRLDFGNLAVLDAKTGDQRWSGGAGGFGIRDDGSAYYSVATASNRLIKTDLADGSQVWSAVTPSRSGPLTLISGDLVYLVGDDGLIAAHRTDDGALVWSTSSGIQSRTGVKGAVGSGVLVLTDGGQVSALG